MFNCSDYVTDGQLKKAAKRYFGYNSPQYIEVLECICRKNLFLKEAKERGYTNVSEYPAKLFRL